MVKRNIEVKSLGLSVIHITHAGMLHLKGLISLRKLYLSGTEITTRVSPIAIRRGRIAISRGSDLSAPRRERGVAPCRICR